MEPEVKLHGLRVLDLAIQAIRQCFLGRYILWAHTSQDLQPRLLELMKLVATLVLKFNQVIQGYDHTQSVTCSEALIHHGDDLPPLNDLTFV